MKLNILILAMFMLIGFAIGHFFFHDPEVDLCVDGAAHQWSRWTDASKTWNDFGYMPQTRYCDKCGKIQVQMHK